MLGLDLIQALFPFSSCHLQHAELLFGIDDAFLGGFFLECFEPFLKGFQVMSQPVRPNASTGN